jgi:nucleoside-diphosphate-sugar epimerase
VILVTGAGGFIGRYVVWHLLDHGMQVRGMVHSSNPFNPSPCLEVVQANVRDLAAVANAVTEARAVVHLAAAKADERDSHAINVLGARNVITACRQAGCRRIINISTQSTKIARRGLYGRTKLEADELFHASGLDVTTLLLSIVYSDVPEGIFGTMLRAVKHWPFIPMFGDGTWVSAPLHVDDIAHAVAACLATDKTIGRTYDLAGPDFVTFDELLHIMGESVGRMPPLVHIPFGLSMLIARIGAALLPHPPVTVSNVLGSNQPTSIDMVPARNDFGFAPRPVREGMARAASQMRSA